MRIPMISRLNPLHVGVFSVFLFLGQIIVGTDPLFALLIAVYISLWAFAFNFTGGIGYPSGSFIFMNGFLSVVLGFVSKTLLGQPGESHLRDPIGTMSCYCVGMAAMGVAAFVSRSLRRKKELLTDFGSLEDVKYCAIGFLIVGLSLGFLGGVVSSGSLFSALRQVATLPTLSIILATIYEIRRSNGKRAFNWINIAGISMLFGFGLFNFTKEGMLDGFVAWFLGALLGGYNFNWRQIVTGGVALALFSYYLVPYSQYVRVKRASTTAENVEVALYYLTRLNETRDLYKASLATQDIGEEAHLYDEREGFLDRLVIIAPDDELIDFTNRGHIFGILPTVLAYENVVPRFIWHDKPLANTGNEYAHELGDVVSDDDTSTGISFSASAEAYHEASWLGLLVILPFNFFLYALICDSVYGSARAAPWAAIPLLQSFTLAPQGGANVTVYLISTGLLINIFVALAGKSLIPAVFRILSGRRSPSAAATPRLVAR